MSRSPSPHRTLRTRRPPSKWWRGRCRLRPPSRRSHFSHETASESCHSRVMVVVIGAGIGHPRKRDLRAPPPHAPRHAPRDSSPLLPRDFQRQRHGGHAHHAADGRGSAPQEPQLRLRERQGDADRPGDEHPRWRFCGARLHRRKLRWTVAAHGAWKSHLKWLEVVQWTQLRIGTRRTATYRSCGPRTRWRGSSRSRTCRTRRRSRLSAAT